MLDESQAEIKISRRNINKLRYVDDTTIMAESKEEVKSLWWKWKASEKAGLKLNIQKMKIIVSDPITSWQIDGETMENSERWFWTVVLEKTLESPLDCKEIQPVHPKENQSWIFTGRTDAIKKAEDTEELVLLNCGAGKNSWEFAGQQGDQTSKGNQPWIFIGRTDAEAERPIFWPPNVRTWLIGKDPDAGKDCRQEEKGTTEDEMVGWHHWPDGHEFEHWWWTGRPGVLQSMGSQSVRHTEWLNWTELNWVTNTFTFRDLRTRCVILDWVLDLGEKKVIRALAV